MTYAGSWNVKDVILVTSTKCWKFYQLRLRSNWSSCEQATSPSKRRFAT